MALFAILGIPLFFLSFFFLLREEQSRLLTEEREAWAGFARGVLWAVPALPVLTLLGDLVGASYRPFRLYLFALYRPHLLPLLLGLGGYVLFCRRKVGYLRLVSFLFGFYTLLAGLQMLGAIGRFDAHLLFLLPLLRIGTALPAAGLFLFCAEETGFRRVPMAVLLALVPMAAAAVTCLYLAHRVPEAALGTLLLLLLSFGFVVWFGWISLPKIRFLRR
jgi:hypothetical protein